MDLRKIFEEYLMEWTADDINACRRGGINCTVGIK